jgi:Ni2+-binding GTPase involved in maturation of urease and hydrogenase
MKHLTWVFALAALLLQAQAPEAAKPESGAASRIIGEVTAPVQNQHISVKTDQGSEINVVLQEKTLYLRVPPGEKDLKKATRIALKDIDPGDRIYARGQMSDDKKSITAVSVIVMTKEDLASKHERDRAEWQTRGISGKITALNPESKEITVSMRSREGQKTVVVGPTDKALFRRYAPDSVRFSDAKASSFAELKVGDQIRVLGDKSEDGARIKPEEIVSGSFRNVAGTVKTVNAAAGEVEIMDLETKKPLTVQVTPETVLRRLPTMVAMMMARRVQAPGAARPMGSGRPPGAGGPPSRAGARPMGGAGGSGDLQQVLEQMPAMPLSELKPGDAIIISTTSGTEPSRVTAITLVAGVEPFLTAAPEGGQQIGGSWNFGDIGLP